MKIDYLEEFLALAETGNYALAAEALFLSASTLSRHIILLEDELGAKLFERSSRSVTLTRTGELLRPYAETIIQARDGFNHSMALEKNDQSRLSIGFSRAAIKYGILEKLLQFQNKHPELQVEFMEASPTHLLQMLRKEECSFSISYKYIFHTNSEYVIRPLFQDTLSVAMHVSHPLAGREFVSLQELKEERFIVHNSGSPTHQRDRELFKGAGIDPNHCIQTESSEFIMQLVAHGFGLSLVGHHRVAGSLPENVALVRLKPEIPQTLVATYRRHKLSEVEKEFLHFLEKVFA